MGGRRKITLYDFTAEQAAQKVTVECGNVSTDFTAEQAAQKATAAPRPATRSFTAEQAAQKIRLIVMAYR